LVTSSTTLRLGDVVLEVTKACDPCTILFTLPYVGKERGPGFLRVMHGRRGWYARVLQGGTIGVETQIEVGGKAIQDRVSE
jgi:MOSC domain-containing protein YiiM